MTPGRPHRAAHRATVLLLVSSVASGTLTFATSSVAKAPSRSASKVYIAARSCTGHSYKPAKVIFACADGNLYATGLKYSSYGSREASATATIHINACKPNCAAGKFQTQSGSVRFSAVVRCKDGRRYFTSARYKYGKRSGTANIEPFTCKKG